MVKIRLARSGAKKRPFYHIVVTDRRNRRDGSYIERLGYFNPVATGQELRLQVDAERVDHWVKIGAQVSERVKALMKEAATEGENGAVKARAKPVSPTAAEKRGAAKTEDAPPAEETKAEEAKAEETKAEEAKAEEAKAEETKAEEAPEEKAEAGAAEAESEDAAPAEAEGTEEDADKQ